MTVWPPVLAHSGVMSSRDQIASTDLVIIQLNTLYIGSPLIYNVRCLTDYSIREYYGLLLKIQKNIWLQNEFVLEHLGR